MIVKILAAAATLLALASPVFAATANPRDFPDIRKWQELDYQCYRAPGGDIDVEITQEDYNKSARGKICLAAARMEKKLEAKGYCTYGKEGVGRTGKKYFYVGTYGPDVTRHCYSITNGPY